MEVYSLVIEEYRETPEIKKGIDVITENEIHLKDQYFMHKNHFSQSNPPVILKDKVYSVSLVYYKNKKMKLEKSIGVISKDRLLRVYDNQGRFVKWGLGSLKDFRIKEKERPIVFHNTKTFNDGFVVMKEGDILYFSIKEKYNKNHPVKYKLIYEGREFKIERAKHTF